MRDARWLDVAEDVAAAVLHFGRAGELFALATFDAPSLEGYRDTMALMHAMQAGVAVRSDRETAEGE